MQWLRQSTARILKLGPFLDDTDGKTAETLLTISQADIQISKNGGAFAQTSDGAPTTTHDADGWYPIPLTTTDTGTLGHLVVQITEAGALPVWSAYEVVPANVWDSFFSTDKLQVDAVEMADDLITAAKFDESTAFPVKSADTGATQIARVGADGDTLETLSDQIDDVPTVAEFEARTIVTADYFDPSADTVVNVTNVATLTGHTVQTGDGYAIVNHADYGNAKLVRSTTPANKLDVSATGEAGLDFANIKDATGAHTLTNITVPVVSALTGHTAQSGDTYALANGTAGFVAIDTVVDSILDDTGTSGVVVADLTGYKLASDGLDTIAITAPAGVASDFREMLVQLWRRFFKKSTLTSTQLKTYADNGSDILTTQTVSDDETTQTQGASS